jgi:predicted small metal-binding protein
MAEKKKISCAALMPGCPYTAEAGSEEELLKKVAVHAAEAHNIHEVTPELLHKVKSVIRTEE